MVVTMLLLLVETVATLVAGEQAILAVQVAVGHPTVEMAVADQDI